MSQIILSVAYLGEDEQNIRINILQAACKCSAWDEVTQKTFTNWFYKISFCRTEDKDTSEADTEIIFILNKWEDIQHDTGICFEDFVNMDEDLMVWN